MRNNIGQCIGKFTVHLISCRREKQLQLVIYIFYEAKAKCMKREMDKK